ncbi:GumC family protein [Cyclobacterium roseum]|uniref:GumC family protein n=1 Tax=Cyclobacterium roseum TaxID=2666137 RepID=UPI001390C90F|nr:tyrosine-protein kinase [Cyclobacterium roseum]
MENKIQEKILKKLNKIEEGENFDLNQILAKLWYYKWLFVFSLAITISLAVYYLRQQTMSYEIQTTLIIPEGNNKPGNEGILKELESGQLPKSVENEIEVLRSRNIISKIVEDLELNVYYYILEGSDYSELYQKKPIKLEIISSEIISNQDIVQIKIKDQHTFSITDENGQEIDYVFSEKVESTIGDWRLEPTEYLKDYIGEVIFIYIFNKDVIINGYKENILVELLNEDSPVVGITLVDEVPQRGISILNRLIDNYNQLTLFERNKIIQNTLDFIDQRLASVAGDLSNVEGEVEDYRSSIGLTDISSQSNIYLQNVQSYDRQLNEVSLQINTLEEIESYILNEENSENIPTILGVSDRRLINLIEQLSELQLEKEDLAATTSENSPLLIRLMRRINSTKSAIKESVSNIKSRLISTKEELEALNAKYEASIKNIPGQEREFISIKRQQAIKEGLYVYLLEKREELSLNFAATLSEVRVVDDPYVSEVYSPQKYKIVGAATLFGLLMPLGLIFLRSLMNNKIAGKAEIEDSLSVPVIAELSFQKLRDPLIMKTQKNNVLTEQFRILRTQLHFLHQKQAKGRVAVLTSSIAKEGKSFIAANLGAALAISDKKTIILELDLRRPEISNMFGLNQKLPGLTSYLKGEVKLEEIIHPSGYHERLFIIPSGQEVTNPSELLEKQELKILITRLREQFDDIILDTPPVKLVTDALLIGGLADLSLYVIRQGHTHKSLLPHIETLISKKTFPNMKIVFNGILDKKYGYKNDYGKGYYEKIN